MPDTEDLEDLTARALLQQLLREVRESNAQMKAQMSAQNSALSSRIELLEAQNNALRSQLETGGTAAHSQPPTPSGSKTGHTPRSQTQEVSPTRRSSGSTTLRGNEVILEPKMLPREQVYGAAKRGAEPEEPITPNKKPRPAEDVPVLLSVTTPEKTTPPSDKGTHSEAAASSNASSSNGKQAEDDGDDIIVLGENPSKTKTKNPFFPHKQSLRKEGKPIRLSHRAAPPKTKRPRLKLEVCIRTDKSSRGRLALAGSLEEVIRSLSLQSCTNYAKRSTGMIGEKHVDYLDGKVDGKYVDLEKAAARPTSSRAKPDYSDLFEGDLTDLTDSEDEDCKASRDILDLPDEKTSSPSSTNIIPPQTAGLNHSVGSPCQPPAITQPKVKPKFNAKSISPEVGRLLFDADSTRRRLTGFTDYPVDLSSDTRNALVTREFMTATYGGSPFEFFPKISADRRAALGGHAHHFLFPNLKHNPHAPQRPGQAGLLCRSGDEAPWGARAMKLLVRIRDGMWWYMGEYTTVRTAPLSPAEFARLARATKWAWASTVRKRKKRYDVEIRARVTLRRQLGREPTADELKCAFAVETKFDKVTEEEIIQAYEDGRERIYIWCFKCVGYDDKFQDELAERFASFVPPPKLGKRTEYTPYMVQEPEKPSTSRDSKSGREAKKGRKAKKQRKANAEKQRKDEKRWRKEEEHWPRFKVEEPRTGKTQHDTEEQWPNLKTEKERKDPGAVRFHGRIETDENGRRTIIVEHRKGGPDPRHFLSGLPGFDSIPESGYLGFSSYDVQELLSQSVKAWDPNAAKILAFLRKAQHE